MKGWSGIAHGPLMLPRRCREASSRCLEATAHASKVIRCMSAIAKDGACTMRFHARRYWTGVELLFAFCSPSRIRTCGLLVVLRRHVRLSAVLTWEVRGHRERSRQKYSLAERSSNTILIAHSAAP